MPWLLIMTILAGSALIYKFALHPHHQRRKQQRIGAQVFPNEWDLLLSDKMPLYRHLPAALKSQLQRHILIFLHNKQFQGCAGIEITLEIKLVIAAQACILLLNREHGYYPKLKHILVYPSLFVVEREEQDAAGVIHHGRRTLSGESWEHGRVIISWENALRGAANPTDGDNVVFHEFAHQLDGETGRVNGAPALINRDAYATWAQVMHNAYDHRFNLNFSEEPTDSVLSQYALTNPAEFFAVATEVFFEQPIELSEQYPQVYLQLQDYYAVDPKSWQLHH